VLIASMVGYNAFTTYNQRDTALIVNITARQRTLVERYIKDVLLKLQGIQADPNDFLPSLVRRGLYREEPFLALGLFPWTRCIETAEGAAARNELAGLKDTVNGKFDAEAREDPRQALALVAILGSAVLLIHGWALDLEMWTPLFLGLARRYRVIAIDRRGFGLSAGAPSLERDALDVWQVLDALNVRRCENGEFQED